MARPSIDRERVARILAEATFLGDETAAQRAKVHRRTIKNYRQRLDHDTELARLFEEKKQHFEREWKDEAVTFLRMSIERLRELVQQAGPEQIREVAGAIKIVGELQVVREALGGEQPGDASEGPRATAAASGNGAGPPGFGLPH